MTGLIRIRRLPTAQDLPLPRYQTAQSAGMDLHAALTEKKDIILSPGTRMLVPTGLQMALPEGFEAQIRPRSGLAFKHGLTVLNSPGTIDADYRGEIKVLLINLGQEAYVIKHGERIAQMVIAPVIQVEWMPVDDLDETDRGEGGFGSTHK